MHFHETMLMLVAARLLMAAAKAGTSGLNEHPAESYNITHAPSIYKTYI